MTSEMTTFFSLSRIVNRVRELLEPALYKTFWVKAELSSGRERGGSYFCELVEINDQGKIEAQMRCTIWVGDLHKMKLKFKQAGLELQLENGTLVGIKCKLQFHPVYGLSLNAIDIDPSLALGELELRKRKLMEKLEEDGLHSINAGKPLTLLPLRLGLITSAGSAAYNDFVKTLGASPYGFKIYVADSSVQGVETEQSICYSLKCLQKLKLDLLIIIRGGGSKIDLSWLDNEKIAREISRSRVQVWTGIGHEIDYGVLDFVAARSFKTPTAAAEELVTRFSNLELQIDEAKSHLKTTWSYRWQSDQKHLVESRKGLLKGGRKLMQLTKSEHQRRRGDLKSKGKAFIQEHSNTLNDKAKDLQVNALQRFKDERSERVHVIQNFSKSFASRLSLFKSEITHRSKRFQKDRFMARLAAERKSMHLKSSTLKAVDPQVNLGRGYSLTYDTKGKLIRSVKDLQAGQEIKISFKDGEATSVFKEGRLSEKKKT